ncbi:rhodanese-like domain-containing protein [Colwellia sp. MSW7]|uniref:Rhodanese-like domain-containing protein n=1 Tax=Colwellia maritima TaxID=2912588 RepID=A0ABS9X3I8_9GAMM|nr:rhodanese-like domain-containing protein [Colwellia maritima]MCI2284794.1 rhodanese-like domain-containing protein [Colwellia maritima]
MINITHLNIIKSIALATSLFISTVFASDIPEISQQAFLSAVKMPSNNIVLLDVRTPAEYNEGHILGAINISHNAIEANLPQLAQYKNSNVVVYCRSGKRAAIAQDILNANGFTKLQHLTGDMNGRLEAKLPVVSQQP